MAATTAVVRCHSAATLACRSIPTSVTFSFHSSNSRSPRYTLSSSPSFRNGCGALSLQAKEVRVSNAFRPGLRISKRSRRHCAVRCESAAAEEPTVDGSAVLVVGGDGEARTNSISGAPDSGTVDSPSSSASNPSSPFKSGKISSRIAAKETTDFQAPGSGSTAEDSISSRKPALAIGRQEPRPAGQLSSKAADLLKVTNPSSVFTQPPEAQKPASSFAQTNSAQKPSNPFAQVAAAAQKPTSPFVQPGVRGKRVLDAFKDGERQGKTTKFGQPVVPANIFDDVRRTPEEQAADAFKFSINPGQLVLVFSFLLIIGLMCGTAFVVWKLGGIHYNEY